MNQHIKLRISIVRPVAICLMLLCAAAMTAHAATFTVSNTNDSGTGSLRQALADANDGDTINFDSSLNGQTITLSSGELLMDKSVTISGPGADLLAVDGNHASRVFYVGSGKTVTISGLTIANGSGGSFGGGIYNDGATLTVDGCTLSGNSALYGGGIFNDGYFSSSATLTVINSTIRYNSADGFGGGICNNSSGSTTLTVTDSTLSSNSAGAGGGIFNSGWDNASAMVTITNSTVSGNSASPGGGIYNYAFYGSATLTLTDSTLSGNSASQGGGIFNDGFAGSATLRVTNSTLSGDAGIFNYGSREGRATLTIGDTILNTGASGANISNADGTVTSLGYNLSNDSGGGFLTATGDQVNTDPLLGPLQDNGGPTLTHALLSGSPAIDAGDPSFTPPPDYDQRGPGFPRAVNGRIDIGAFEVQTPPVCPQPQGYWKNNPDAWPVESLPLGSQTYTRTELLNILNTPIGPGPKADASLILADQLIAAKLNIANGSDGTPVADPIADADAVLSLYSGKLPYGVRTNSTNGQRMVNDATILNDYNNGALTPGCGE